MIVPPAGQQVGKPPPQTPAVPPIDPALEAHLLRERRKRYGKAVREQLARKASAAETRKQAVFESRQRDGGPGRAAGGPDGAGPPTQVSSAPPSWGRAAAGGQQQQPKGQPASTASPKTADALQAILATAQRLEQKLAALPSGAPGFGTIPAVRRKHAKPIEDFGGQSREQGRHALQTPSSQSSLSSITTPASSGLGTSTESLASEWGLRASRKLHRLLRHRQTPRSRASEAAAGSQEEQHDAGHGPRADLQGRFSQTTAPVEPAPSADQPAARPAAPRHGGAEDMVERLLRMEGDGDPFSIINIYLEERQQEQQRQSLQRTQGTQPACGGATKEAHQRQQGQQGKLAPSGGAAPLAVAQADEERPISAASNQENVSANVGSPGPRQAGQAARALSENAQHHAQPLALATAAPNALQAELERLVEMHEVELELAHLQHSQVVGAARREIDSLQAALDQQAAQQLFLEYSRPGPQAAGQAAPPLPQLPMPLPLSGAELGSCGSAPGVHAPAAAVVHPPDPQLQRLSSAMHLSQQQQQQQQRQTQSALAPLGQPVKAPLPCVPAAAQLRQADQQQPVLQQLEEQPQAWQPLAREPKAPCLLPMPPGPPQQLGGSEAAAEALLQVAAGSRHLYVQQWLDGSASEDQYSLDPDHEEGGLEEQQQHQQQQEVDGSSAVSLLPVLASAVRAVEVAGRPSIPGSEAGAASSNAVPLPAHKVDAAAYVVHSPSFSAVDKWQPPGAALVQQSPPHAGAAAAVGALSRAHSTPEQPVAGSPAASASEALGLLPSPCGGAGPALTSLPAAAAEQQEAVVTELPDNHPAAAAAAAVAPQPLDAASPAPVPTAGGSAAVPGSLTLASPAVEGSTYTMSFDEDLADAEFSYTDQYTVTTLAPGAAGMAAAEVPALPGLAQGSVLQLAAGNATMQPPAAAAEHPASPRQLARLHSPPAQPGRPTSPTSPRHRSVSPHALDDKYPTPPRSPHHGDSCPASPSNLGPEAPSGSRPGSPLALDLHLAASEQRTPAHTSRAATPEAELQQQDSGGGQQPSCTVEAACAPPDAEAVASAAPQLTEQADTVLPASGAEHAATAAVAQQEQQQHGLEPPAPPQAAAVLLPAAAAPAPPSPRVEDNTVVQTEEHARQYVEEVLDYFWQHRAQAYVRGEQPLDLEGFLHLERRRPPVGDPQHIHNKLLYDACNEALAQHYNKTLTSFAGKVAPEHALLDQARVSQFVTVKVLGWAGMACTAADIGRMLAEDAAEDERTRVVLTEMMLRELAHQQYRSTTASPTAEQE